MCAVYMYSYLDTAQWASLTVP